MNEDAASLSNMKDIVIPDVPALWPPATGVWILLALILVTLSLAGYTNWKSWTHNAYRRIAIVSLADVKTLPDLSVLLKRVALVSFPRTEVASLYGEEWITFLNNTVAGPSLPPSLNDSSPLTDEIIEFARRWISNHRVLSTETRH
jgi:hypothetical protein